MNLLADSHVLIWMLGRPNELSLRAREAIQKPANTLFFSHVSIWELEIKKARQRIVLPDDWVETILSLGFIELPIGLEDIRASARLPWHHRDPFDRLLVGQAKVYRFTLITRDSVLARYDLPLLAA